MMLFARIVLGLTALMHAGFGAAYVIAPVGMAKLSKFELTAPMAVTEMRAFYGGLELGWAAFLVICAVRPGWIVPGLAAVLCVYVGLIGARVLGIVLDKSGQGLILHILAVECVTAALAGVALALLRSRPGP